jgi:ribonucleoside-diphosphate reductase alpha chain
MKAPLTQNGRLLLESRYLRKDPGGRPVETPEEMFARVARNVASAEDQYPGGRPAADVEQQFLEAMLALDFLPNSPALMNAGRELQQLAACFVLGIEDSIESIFETLKSSALIHQSGGGTGFSFSSVRPRGDYISTSGGRASGPLSFIRIFNEATEAINQGGFRRGANMAILRVDHPDIEEFIRAKEQEGELVNFNISVAITDAFMKALQAGAEYELVNPRTGQPARRVAAQEIFELIVHCAWKNGEPGVVFIDRINEQNPTPDLGMIEATNPCGEAPLLAYESCVLGSINLSHALRGTPPACTVDWDRLQRLTHMGVRFLDNVISVTRFPLSQVRAMTLGNRKIGLGVMGFADMLIRRGIAYDSPAAVQAAEEVMAFVCREADAASERLARERGPFPNFERSVYAGRRPPLRNAVRTTIAPTGSISMIAGCSGGIEPIFAVAFQRRVLGGQPLREVHPDFLPLCERQGFIVPEGLMREVLATGRVRPLPEFPDLVRRLFVTSGEIPPVQHLAVQAAFQRHTGNAVSKTLNLPRESTPDDVREVFLKAYELGCKGVTVYRDTSRLSQVLATECCRPAEECGV